MYLYSQWYFWISMTFLSISYRHNHKQWKEGMDPISQDFVTFQVPETSDDARPPGRSNRSSIVTPAEPDVELVVPLMVTVNESLTDKDFSSPGMYVWSRIRLLQSTIAGFPLMLNLSFGAT